MIMANHIRDIDYPSTIYNILLYASKKDINKFKSGLASNVLLSTIETKPDRGIRIGP